MVPSQIGALLGQNMCLLLHSHILLIQLQYRQLVYGTIHKYFVYNLVLQGYYYEYPLQDVQLFHGRWQYAYQEQVFAPHIPP